MAKTSWYMCDTKYWGRDHIARNTVLACGNARWFLYEFIQPNVEASYGHKQEEKIYTIQNP